MTRPNTVQEQLDETYFIPKHKLAVYFATENFSAVYKKDPDEIVKQSDGKTKTPSAPRIKNKSEEADDKAVAERPE